MLADVPVGRDVGTLVHTVLEATDFASLAPDRLLLRAIELLDAAVGEQPSRPGASGSWR